MEIASNHKLNGQNPHEANLSPLPSGWCWITVGEAGEVRLGRQRSPKNRSANHPTKYIRAANITWDGLDLSDVLDMEFKPKEQETYRLRPGDVVLSEASGSADEVGKPALWNCEIENCCFQNTVIRFRPAKADPRFALIAFQHFARNAVFSQVAKGVGIHHLGADRFSAIPFPLPPLNEQRRIVAKIDELFSDLDAAIAALKRAKANLKNYRAAVLKAAVEGKLTAEWRAKNQTEPASKLLERILAERRSKWEADQLAKFAAAGKEPPRNWKAKYVEPTPPDANDLPDLPVGWCWASLDALSSLVADIDHNMPKSVNKGIKFLSAKDLWDDGTLNFTKDIKLISEADYQRLARKVQPQRNDIIYSRIGARLGKARLVETDERFLVSYSCCTIRPLGVQPRFLARYLDCGFVLARALSNTQSIGVPDLGLDRIKRFAVPLCSVTEQAQIVTEIEQRLSVITAADQQVMANLLRATHLRQSILKHAFQGLLVPQDTNDEPAAVLLKRTNAANGKPKTKKHKRSKQEAK